MLVRDGQVMLGRRLSGHGAGSYGWAGGHLEYGEALHDCALRELWEETGIQLAAQRLALLSVNNVLAYGRHYIDIAFRAYVSDEVPEVREPTKVESWSWYSLDALPAPLFAAVELGIKAHLDCQIYDWKR